MAGVTELSCGSLSGESIKNMKILTRDKQNVHLIIDPKNEPRIEITSGEELLIETERADCMFLSRENPYFRDQKHVVEIGVNPVTGPIFIKDANPGDILEVEILDIKPGDDGSEGYFAHIKGQGLFTNPFFSELDAPPRTVWCAVDQPKLKFGFGEVEVEVDSEPFIGTISVASKEIIIPSSGAAKEICGNVDCHYIKKGSKILLPVNVPGALLSIGDMHAAQGAGELISCALECRGSLVIKTQVLKREDVPYFDWIQVDTDEFIGSVAHALNSMEVAVKSAVYDIVKRMEHMTLLDYLDAYMLMGQCVKIEICQMVGSYNTVIAMIPKDIINKLNQGSGKE